MQSVNISAALDKLRETRAKKRESALRLGALLESASDQLKQTIDEKSLQDPITEGPLLATEWTANDRGFSFTLSAFGGKYACSLEVHFEHGGILVSGVGGAGEEPDNFYKLIFRGEPLRLTKADEGRIDLVRRVNGNEHAMSIDALLGNFIGAVTFYEARGAGSA